MIDDETAREWVLAGIATIDSGSANFVQDDWDELSGGLEERPSTRRAIQLFTVMLSTLYSASRPELCLMLVLPLPASVRLLRSAPSLKQMLERPWRQIRLPGFYVMRRELWTMYEGWEEYRRPFELDGDWSGPPIRAEYRAFRTREDLQCDWEYDRGLYFISLPQPESIEPGIASSN